MLIPVFAGCGTGGKKGEQGNRDAIEMRLAFPLTPEQAAALASLAGDGGIAQPDQIVADVYVNDEAVLRHGQGTFRAGGGAIIAQAPGRQPLDGASSVAFEARFSLSRGILQSRRNQLVGRLRPKGEENVELVRVKKEFDGQGIVGGGAPVEIGSSELDMPDSDGDGVSDLLEAVSLGFGAVSDKNSKPTEEQVRSVIGQFVNAVVEEMAKQGLVVAVDASKIDLTPPQAGMTFAAGDATASQLPGCELGKVSPESDTVETDESDATVVLCANEPARFRCSLDGAAYSSCLSPVLLVNLGMGSHSLVLAASDASGNSQETPLVFLWKVISGTAASPPSVPSGVSAKAGNGGVTLAWNAATGATAYKVYYGTSATALNQSVVATETQTSVGNLTNGTTYYFVVTSTTAALESGKSESVSATPNATTQEVVLSAPIGVLTTAGDGQVTASWTAVSGASGYKLYYGTAQDQLDTTAAATTTSEIVTGLSNGTTYFFAVTGVSGSAESAKSAVVSAKPTAVTDAKAPTFAGLSTTTATSTVEIVLSWAVATDNVSASTAITYRICQSTASGSCQTSFTATYTTSAGATSYNVTGLTAATTYYFVVRSVDAAGNQDSNTTQVAVATLSTFAACNNNSFECCFSWVADVPGCLIAIPPGTFVQGSRSGEGNTDENPRRLVTLSAYYMDKYEVTNASYKDCVAAAACTLPSSANSYDRTPYYGDATYDNYPVIYVSWNQAKVYCSWKGRRLPTEAEWEKAARGPADGSLVGLAGGQCTTADAAGAGTDANCNLRPYPWGGTITTVLPYATGADCTKLNYDRYYENGNVPFHCVGDTSPAGTYPTGASPYGVRDMAGNVYEWVNDWYDSVYYSTAPSTNPQGPASGATVVFRGGGWHFYSSGTRVVNRNNNLPTLTDFNIGFRCARTP